MKHDIYDVIIVGGGPAGCNAAMVLARSRRTVLIIDEGKHRNQLSQGIHNYLTRDGVKPGEYLELAYKEMADYHIPIIRTRAIKARQLEQKGFEITDNTGTIYLCRRLLLATGVTDKIPDIPGIQELWGCCVHHCPFCDGWECRDKVIALYSRNVNGYGMAMALQHLSKEVILFTDGRSYLKTKQRSHLQALNIRVISRRVKELLYDNKQLHHIALQNGEQVPCDVLFVNHGHHVNSELLEQLDCRRTKLGAAITNKQQQTSIPGVYVAGDASFDMHFVVVAAAEGAKAAVAIHSDLLNTDNLKYQ